MKKLIVISPGHCGTRLLIESLNRHPEVKKGPQEPLSLGLQCKPMYGNFIKKKFGYDIENVDNNTKIKLRCKEYFSHILSKQDVVKLLYHHYFNTKDCEIHQYIMSYIDDFVVVHLTRKNISSILFSRIIHYNNFDLSNFSSHFSYISVSEKLIDYYYYNKILKIYYEDLVKDWDFHINLIQSVMQIKQIKTEKHKKKTKRKKFSELFSINDIPDNIKNNFSEERWKIEE